MGKETFGDYSPESVVVTADLPHVLEYLWNAATALHKEGSGGSSAWVHAQRRRLLDSRVDLVQRELREILAKIPKRGPGNKGKRTRVEKALKYVTDNASRLDYKLVRRMDLELASGMVEGSPLACRSKSCPLHASMPTRESC